MAMNLLLLLLKKVCTTGISNQDKKYMHLQIYL